MEKHDINHLETQIKELRGSLAALVDDKDLQHFLVTIRHPGFTTPAEFLLFPWSCRLDARAIKNAVKSEPGPDECGFQG